MEQKEIAVRSQGNKIFETGVLIETLFWDKPCLWMNS
jgi:hypothetical protein